MKCIQTEHYAELAREMFFLRLIPMEEDVFRCVFSQEPVMETESAFIEQTDFEPVPYSMEETESSFRIRTKAVQAEVLKEDGRIIWTRLGGGANGAGSPEGGRMSGKCAGTSSPEGGQASGNCGDISGSEAASILLEEGPKELEKIDVMRYTTGGEAPVINRVKTVDGERNFIQNLKQVADHQAYKGSTITGDMTNICTSTICGFPCRFSCRIRATGCCSTAAA